MIQTVDRGVINKFHWRVGTLNCKYVHVGWELDGYHRALVLHTKVQVLVRALNEHSCNTSRADSEHLYISRSRLLLYRTETRGFMCTKSTNLLLRIIEKHIREAADRFEPDGIRRQLQVVIIVLPPIISFHVWHIWSSDPTRLLTARLQPLGMKFFSAVDRRIRKSLSSLSSLVFPTLITKYGCLPYSALLHSGGDKWSYLSNVDKYRVLVK